MKKMIFLIIGVFIEVSASAQSSDANINPDLLTRRWQATWISHPTASLKDYGVFHFRRTFDLKTQPEKFIVHVSADNRYHLFVNGQSVCRGPARGDFMHWRFETVDIAPYLVKGKNTIAAAVWNFGEFIPAAQMSLRTAFVLAADDSKKQLREHRPEMEGHWGHSLFARSILIEYLCRCRAGRKK